MLQSAVSIPVIVLAVSSFLWTASEAEFSIDSEINGTVLEHTFQPDGSVGKDAYVTSLIPSANYGSSIELIVAYLISGYYHYWNSFIQFTELDDPQYEGVTVVSAELQLYAYDWCSGTFVINVITERWDEFEVAWNNHPDYTGNQYVSCYTGHDWLSIDVTDYVQNWLNGSEENCGFLLRQATLLDEFNFYSSDFDSLPELRPRLILTYIQPSPLGRNTWAQIKTSW